jgi:hypothetical protein
MVATMRRATMTAVALLATLAGVAAAGDGKCEFKVRAERPRIWIRAQQWAGPSIPEPREWFKRPEHRERGIGKQAALQWLGELSDAFEE